MNCEINTEYKDKCCCGYLQKNCNWHKYETCSQNIIILSWYKLKQSIKL